MRVKTLYHRPLPVLAIILIALTFIIRLPCLAIYNQEYKPIMVFYAPASKTFSYRFIHSVHKTPVQENFTITPDGQLQLTSTSYQSLGVGMPFLPGEGNITNQNGTFVISGLDRFFGELNLRAMPVAQQSLLIGGDKYMLNDYFRPGELINIKTKKLSLISFILHKLAHGQ